MFNQYNLNRASDAGERSDYLFIFKGPYSVSFYIPFSVVRFVFSFRIELRKYVQRSANLFYIMNENAVEFRVDLLLYARARITFRLSHVDFCTLDLDNYKMIE